MLWRPELELNLDLYIDPYLVLYVALCWGAAPNEVSGVQRGLKASSGAWCRTVHRPSVPFWT